MTTNANLEGLAGLRRAGRVDADSVALVAMPLFHIGGMGWLLVGPARGRADACSCAAIDPTALLDTMEREHVTNAFLVPTVCNAVSA